MSRRWWVWAASALFVGSAALQAASVWGRVLALQEMERSGAGLGALSFDPRIPFGAVLLLVAGIACLGVAFRSRPPG